SDQHPHPVPPRGRRRRLPHRVRRRPRRQTPAARTRGAGRGSRRAALLRRVRTTQRPFEEAVRSHGVTVLRVCRAALGAGADADDAWSETFLAALRAWPDLAEDANVEAWLVRIAQRKTIDVIRARGRRAAPVADLPEPRMLEAEHDGSA